MLVWAALFHSCSYPLGRERDHRLVISRRMRQFIGTCIDSSPTMHCSMPVSLSKHSSASVPLPMSQVILFCLSHTGLSTERLHHSRLDQRKADRKGQRKGRVGTRDTVSSCLQLETRGGKYKRKIRTTSHTEQTSQSGGREDHCIIHHSDLLNYGNTLLFPSGERLMLHASLMRAPVLWADAEMCNCLSKSLAAWRQWKHSLNASRNCSPQY